MIENLDRQFVAMLKNVRLRLAFVSHSNFKTIWADDAESLALKLLLQTTARRYERTLRTSHNLGTLLY